MQPVCAIRGDSRCGGVASQGSANLPGTSEEVKAMNLCFSQHPGQVLWEKGPLGWLDSKSGGCGCP